MLAAAIGLVFAVLTERIRFGTALKTLIFMPMAISFLAAGVIFRFVYDEDPDRGLANAMLTTVTDIWQSPGAGRCATVDNDALEQKETYVSTGTVSPGTEMIGIVGLRPDDVADDQQAEPAEASGDAIAGTVWLDFTRGGGGQRGEIDRGEVGPHRDRGNRLRGEVVSRATTDDDRRIRAWGSTQATTSSAWRRRTSISRGPGSGSSARRSSHPRSSARSCGSGPASR